jgi:formylmethanofuran dehydrogenase subunit B
MSVSVANSTFTCGLCPSWCDDLPRTELAAFSTRCPIFATTWSADTSAQPVIDHRAALADIAKQLHTARRPLIWGLQHATMAAQTAAITLAEKLRGVLLIGTTHPSPHGALLARIGEARTTLGEIRRFADLIICWDCQPWQHEPRFVERWRLDNEDSAKVVSLLTTQPNESEYPTPLTEDVYYLEREQLWLRSEEWLAQQSQQLATWRTRTAQVRSTAEDQLWDGLHQEFESARYPVIVYDQAQLIAQHGTMRGQQLIENLEQIVLTASKTQRTAAWPCKGTGNLAGAEYVLTARTGYNHAVDFGSGEARPYTIPTQSASSRPEFDALLCVGQAPTADLLAQLGAEVPCFVIHESTVEQAAISINCAPLSSSSTGTVLRGDGIPLPLRPWRKTSAPELEKLLNELIGQL